MTAYGGKELANGFRTVRKTTVQVAEDIPESQYGHVAALECKSVGRMLTHIAVAQGFWDEIHRKQRRTTMQGIDFVAMGEHAEANESNPRSTTQIVDLLRTDPQQLPPDPSTFPPQLLPPKIPH